MSYYYIHTFDPIGSQYQFSSQAGANNKEYQVDDRTGYVMDDKNQQVKISYLQKRDDLYSVVPVAACTNISDGGASSYYDFPPGAVTLNDLVDLKSDNQWLGDSFHLANIVKAAWRWGNKAGVDKTYDARKIIYSGCRLLMKLGGVKEVRKMLQSLLDDPQFQERN